MVTQRCSEKQKADQIRLVEEVIAIGWVALTDKITPEVRAEIDRLSMASVEGRRTAGWIPNGHPWWCLQNSLAPALSVSKRSLTPGGLRAVRQQKRHRPGSCASRAQARLVQPAVHEPHLEQRALDFLEAVDRERDRKSVV